MRKEYLIDGKSREVLARLKEVLVPVTKTFDVTSKTLDDLFEIGVEIEKACAPQVRRRTWSAMDETDAYHVMRTLDFNVVAPILQHEDLPTGGEQRGNMLCIEDGLARIAHLQKK